MKTVDKIRKERKVTEAAKNHLKEYNKMKKIIKEALKQGPLSVPQIAEKTDIKTDTVMYYLMTMLKYGMVEVDSIDDMDEYYLYKLTDAKNKK